MSHPVPFSTSRMLSKFWPRSVRAIQPGANWPPLETVRSASCAAAGSARESATSVSGIERMVYLG